MSKFYSCDELIKMIDCYDNLFFEAMKIYIKLNYDNAFLK